MDGSSSPLTGPQIARGVCRHLRGLGFSPLTEFSPTRGLRTDITAINKKGEVWVIECKSSHADFQSDQKWHGYLDWCDQYFWAVTDAFDRTLLPPEHGQFVSDGYGAALLRPAQPAPLNGARRKSLLINFGRVAALRLRGLEDPAPDAAASLL